MAKIDVEQTFAVPAGLLYTTICDMDSWSEWFSMHSEFVEKPPDKLRVNSRYIQVLQVMGMPFTVEFTVTEFRPPRELVLAGRGSAGMTCTFAFGVSRAPGPAGTTLAMTGEFESPMLNDQLETVLVDTLSSQLTLSLERLAALARGRAARKSAI
ncbi:SRPBCC family protein [Mycobacterium sp. CPCC 205372]|uniref:SRPBCC family protein n=1 Tax=Mycobacterium hippophais TaxID=3016340 RepID=A0ABT4PS21_9MYCO|nr:SRPBCC family protein [Mycobacterium hippophais]MCZ8379360.1 SRPBCC family protein [Mycobacterium hippophais]